MARQINDEEAQTIAGQVLIRYVQSIMKSALVEDVVASSPLIHDLALQYGVEELNDDDKDLLHDWVELATVKLEVGFE